MGYANYLFERSLIQRASETDRPGAVVLRDLLARVDRDDVSSDEWADAVLLAELIRPQGQRVHNHPPYRPNCNERIVNGKLRGACLEDDGIPDHLWSAHCDEGCCL